MRPSYISRIIRHLSGRERKTQRTNGSQEHLKYGAFNARNYAVSSYAKTASFSLGAGALLAYLRYAVYAVQFN